ncbi:MAG: hypothetical protein EOO11_09570 [Chitinophagaceae bacterium]|nr:MAG: hypothetical protein EOO11_09570 [Chitinophagaceae bacterium]
MNLLSARGLRCALLLSGALFIASAAGAQRRSAKRAVAPAATTAPAAYRVAAYERPGNTWGFTVYKNDVAVHGQDKIDGQRAGYADKAAAEAAANAYVRRLKAEEKH